jgi:hypothetical protein
MRVNFYLSGNPVHDRVIAALYDGCPEDKAIVRGFKYEPSDVAVIFGMHKSKIKLSWPRGKVFRQQREKNLDVIVLETGYVNRGDGESNHYAAGFNGLNGRADFRNKGMGPDRWEALGQQLRPYSMGDKVILCAQVPWDASVDMHDHKKWIEETAAELKKLTQRPIVFRPHPLAKLPPLPGCEYSTEPLENDLKNAHCVVTFNSNSAVEALIYGKPVFAFDEGSMAWDIAGRNLADIEEPKRPIRPQWAWDLAYAQWTIAEMAAGLTWKHLFR